MATKHITIDGKTLAVEVVDFSTDSLLTHNGIKYEQAELDAAFDLVKSPTHWKDPIEAVINEADVAVVTAAIIHFTATTPEFFFKGSRCYVIADGYRAGPAGDH